MANNVILHPHFFLFLFFFNLFFLFFTSKEPHNPIIESIYICELLNSNKETLRLHLQSLRIIFPKMNNFFEKLAFRNQSEKQKKKGKFSPPLQKNTRGKQTLRLFTSQSKNPKMKITINRKTKSCNEDPYLF